MKRISYARGVDRIRFERELEIVDLMKSAPFPAFRKWCRYLYPNYDVDRAETILRESLMQGISWTASQHGISRQRVDQIINQQINRRKEYKEICSFGPCMDYMPLNRLANEMGFSLWKLRKWERDGELHGIKIRGRFLVNVPALKQKIKELESNNERQDTASAGKPYDLRDPH